MKRLLLFGVLEAQQDDHTLPVAAGKPRELLACLALRAGKRLTRDALAGWLYADYPAERARRSLVDVLHRLRRSLGDGWLQVDGNTIALEKPSLWVDTWEFETAITPARALQLYRGDLAEDVDADWILSDRMRLRDRCLFILECECRRLLECREYRNAVEFAQRWVAIEPLSEEACCLLMQDYAQLGCFDLALRQWERLTAELVTELGQQPSFLAAELARAIATAQEARLQSAVSTLVSQFQHPVTHSSGTSYEPRPVRERAHLVRADVPLGRLLQIQDYTDLWWTTDAGEEDADILRQAGPIALRRHRLSRLLLEARNQGALPTHADLAQALRVCTRTIARDLAIVKVAGTRRSKRIP